MKTIDYSVYQSLSITRRGPNDSVLDIQMKALNGKLPTAGHAGHEDLCEVWRDVGRDDSVRCAVLHPTTLEPMPKGFVGELWAASPMLYTAYVGAPALTAEKLQPMPPAMRSRPRCAWRVRRMHRA